MKNTKQFISLILSLVMMLSLFTACTSTEVPETSTPVQIQEPTTEPEIRTETTAPVTSALILSAEKDAELQAASQARRNEILNTETKIVHSDTFIPGETYTGTAYYFSCSEGNDNNDGLSPESPFASLCVLYSLDLQPGDAVFFKRGDMWRMPGSADPFIWCAEGVTYSAYGDGPKPIFTGSPENGASAEKWELYHEGSNGEKIWKFYRNLPDTGGLVINDEETVLTRAYGWWTGSEYIDVSFNLTEGVFFDDFVTYGWEIHSGDTQTPESSLNDLQFCCMIDYTGCDFPIMRYDVCKQGPLYLRCDEGNPGTVYNSIEFMTKELDVEGGGWWGIINCAAGCVIDNLNVSYFSDAGICAPFNVCTVENVIVQNCEVAYGGNCIHAFLSAQPTNEQSLSGDGIYGMAANATVRNNYVHDVDGGAITFETFGEHTDMNYNGGHYVAQSNLVERCGAGVQLNDGNNMWQFEEITISDNILLDIGGGWTHNCFCGAASIAVGSWGVINMGQVNISDNIMNGSTMYLLDCWTYNETFRLNNNTLIQTPGGAFLCFPGHGWQIIKDIEKTSSILSEIGESSPAVYFAN